MTKNKLSVKAYTIMKSKPNAFKKAHAIKDRWQREGYVDARVEERWDRYIVLTHGSMKHMSEAERAKREGRY